MKRIGLTGGIASGKSTASAILLAGLFLSFYVRPWEQNRREEHADESDS